MNDREKNPARCEKLRENERDLFRQLEDNQRNQEVTRNNLRQARDKYSTLTSELLELQKNLIVSTPTLLISGGNAAAAGTLDNNISIRIAYLESEIREMLPKITELEFLLEKYKDDQSRLESDVRTNAAQMDGLGCVSG